MGTSKESFSLTRPVDRKLTKEANPKVEKIRLQKTIESKKNCKKLSPKPITAEQMSSREFCKDPNAHLGVASQYVMDAEAMRFFREAIELNNDLFHGRIVLDIGCGLGILSLFAAKAGAAFVYAVDCSNVVDYTRRIVVENGYANIIHVIKGRIEDVELPVQHVDIIICDWMGYSLLFESLCHSVIFARNKWLKPVSGLIIPDMAKLYIAPIEDSKSKNEKIDWWNDVYGFKMRVFRDIAIKEPIFKAVQPKQILGKKYKIMALNLHKATYNDLRFRTKFKLEIEHSGCMEGICTYFKVIFSKSQKPVVLSTEPGTVTRWMQTVSYFDHYVAVNAGDLLYGGIEMYAKNVKKPNLNNMRMNVEVYSGHFGTQSHNFDVMRLRAQMAWQLKPHLSEKFVKDKEAAATKSTVSKQTAKTY